MIRNRLKYQGEWLVGGVHDEEGDRDLLFYWQWAGAHDEEPAGYHLQQVFAQDKSEVGNNTARALEEEAWEDAEPHDLSISYFFRI